MLNATIQLGAGESDLSPAYSTQAHGHSLRNHYSGSGRSNTSGRGRSGSGASAGGRHRSRSARGASNASSSSSMSQSPMVRNSSAAHLRNMTAKQHDDPSNWKLPLAFLKTKQEQHLVAEQRLLNKASFLQSLFFGVLGIALAAIPQIVMSSGSQVCCFGVSDLFGETDRNISIPLFLFHDPDDLANISASPVYTQIDSTEAILVTYFVALALQLIGWIVYAICVWRKVFRSWMTQQRFVVVGMFQWTAIVISFSEVALARPAFFAAQMFVLLACIYKFSRVGFRWSIICAVGALFWYFLSAVISQFALQQIHPAVGGYSDYEKLVFTAIGVILCVVLTLPSYYERQLTVQDFEVVNEWLDRLNELKVNMNVRVSLINTVFPRSVGLRLANRATTYAKSHESSSIMFFKITGLMDNPALTQQAAYQHLCNIVCLFDDLSVSLGVEKIKAIGDIFMAAAGLPDHDESHATAIADMALACCKHLKNYAAKHNLDVSWKVGIGSGRVVAGVIGSHKLIYDVFGDTVNIASRMYSHCPYGKIQCPENVARLIAGDFILEPHPEGQIQIKGKGLMRTFFVTGNKIQPMAAGGGSDDDESFEVGNVREVLAMLNANNGNTGRDGNNLRTRSIFAGSKSRGNGQRMTIGHGPQSARLPQKEEVNLLLQSLGLHKIVIEYFMDPFKCSMAQHNSDWFQQVVFQYNLRSMDKSRRAAGSRVAPIDKAGLAALDEAEAASAAERGEIASSPVAGGLTKPLDYASNIVAAGECADQLQELTKEYLDQLRQQRSGPFAVQFWWLVFLMAESILTNIIRTSIMPLYQSQFGGSMSPDLADHLFAADDTVAYLQTYFVAPCVLVYTIVLSSDRLPCLLCCTDTAFFYLSVALKLLIGVGVVLQVAFGGELYATSFLLLIFWIAAFSYLTHVTRTTIVAVLLGLLLAVSIPILIHNNSLYYTPQNLPGVEYIAQLSQFTLLQSILFLDISVISLLAITILFSSQSYGHHTRKVFLKHKALSCFYEDKEEVIEMLDDVLAKLPLTEPAIQSFKAKGRIDQILFDTFSTVLFADIVGFTTFSSTVKAAELVKILNSMFIKFDTLANEFGIEKIKTIGDCYVAATGIFTDWTKTQEPTVVMVQFAQQMLVAMEELNMEYDISLQIRVGIHCGPVIAGIMGKERLAFDLWGPTVEAANEMEANGTPSKVHLSHSVYERCCDHFGDVFTEVPRLSREEQHLGIKREGFGCCIDVAGYNPQVTTTFLIDAVQNKTSFQDDLYTGSLNLNASLASANLLTISRPVAVNHEMHVTFDKATGQFSGLPQELASSLNGQKDGKQQKKPKGKKAKKDKKKDKKAKKNSKNDAAAKAEGHDSDGSSESSLSSGSGEKDFVQRGKSERQLRNAAQTLLPALHEHEAEDGTSSVDSDDASSNDPFSTAVGSSSDPLQRLSQYAPEHQRRRSLHSAARVRRSNGGFSGHSSPANMARSPHVHPELLAQQRLAENPQEKQRSSLAKAKARQRAQLVADRGGGNLERTGSYGEDLDLSAPSQTTGGMEFNTLNPLAVASARRSGRSNGNINRSTTLDLGAETKIYNAPLRQNLSGKNSWRTESKIEAKMRGSR